MSALWGDRAKTAVQSSAEQAKSFQNAAYGAEMQRRYLYYVGAQIVQNPTTMIDNQSTGKDLATKWLSSLSGPGVDDIRAMLAETMDNSPVKPIGIPFLKKCIDSLWVVYQMPVRSRTIIRNGENDERDSTLLAEITASAAHNVWADQFCKWTGLFDTAFQCVTWDDRRQTLRYRNLAPYEVWVDAAPEDPTDLQHPNARVALRMSRPQGDLETSDIWQVWQGNEFWYQEDGGHEFIDVTLTNKGRNPNPYMVADETAPFTNEYGTGWPVKPVLLMHSAPSDEIYFAGDDLKVGMNQRMDRLFTALGYTAEFQGFAIPKFVGVNRDDLKGQVIAPAAPVVLDSQDADFSFEHPAAPLGEMMSIIVKFGRMFARLADLDPEEVDPQSKVSSGVSKAQARTSLQERRQSLVPMWSTYEHEFVWLTTVVWNAHCDAGDNFGEFLRYARPGKGDPVVETVYGDIPAVADPLADAMMLKMLVEMNMTSVPEIIAGRLGISLEQAKDRHDEIEEYNKQFGFTSDDNKQPSTFGEMARLGQPGNRPLKPEQPGQGDVTGSSGNATIPS